MDSAQPTKKTGKIIYIHLHIYTYVYVERAEEENAIRKNMITLTNSMQSTLPLKKRNCIKRRMLKEVKGIVNGLIQKNEKISCMKIMMRTRSMQQLVKLFKPIMKDAITGSRIATLTDKIKDMMANITPKKLHIEHYIDDLQAYMMEHSTYKAPVHKYERSMFTLIFSKYIK